MAIELKAGDRVTFLRNNMREHGHVSAINEDVVTLDCLFGNTKRHRSEVFRADDHSGFADFCEREAKTLANYAEASRALAAKEESRTK